MERLGYTVHVTRGTSLEEKLRNIQRGTELKTEVFEMSDENTIKNEVLDKPKSLFFGVSSDLINNDGVYALDLEQPSTVSLSFGLQKDSEYREVNKALYVVA